MSDAAAPRPLLSIITVFWNGREEVPRYFRAMEAARRALPFHLEVIAIDNASADGTADAIRGHNTRARLIANDENVGFAAACNQGLAAARGRFLLLLNPDCEVNPDALRHMVRMLEDNKGIGAIGCELLHDDGLPQHSAHREPSGASYWGTHSLLSPLLLRIRKRLNPVRSKRRPKNVGWLMGACLMVPRRVYRQVGGLDPEYFMYSEDADWCRRIRDAGYRVVHDPRVAIIHHHGTSARRTREFTFRRLYRSLLMYTLRHHTPWQRLLLRAAVMTDLALRVPLYAARQQKKERLQSVRAVLRMYASEDPSVIEEPRPAETG